MIDWEFAIHLWQYVKTYRNNFHNREAKQVQQSFELLTHIQREQSTNYPWYTLPMVVSNNNYIIINDSRYINMRTRYMLGSIVTLLITSNRRSFGNACECNNTRSSLSIVVAMPIPFVGLIRSMRISTSRNAEKNINISTNISK